MDTKLYLFKCLHFNYQLLTENFTIFLLLFKFLLSNTGSNYFNVSEIICKFLLYQLQCQITLIIFDYS